MAEKKTVTRSKRKPTKDRVLQARIPEQLDDELRDRAEQLGLSVSTIVRNVLLHTFELVEGVVTDSAQVGRALRGDKATSVPSRTESPSVASGGNSEEVVGWQEAILNRNGICDTCNTILPVGERAAVGVPRQTRAIVLCMKCLEALSPRNASGDSNKPPVTKTRARSKKSP
jgi:hypothetical protein